MDEEYWEDEQWEEIEYDDEWFEEEQELMDDLFGEAVDVEELFEEVIKYREGDLKTPPSKEVLKLNDLLTDFFRKSGETWTWTYDKKGNKVSNKEGEWFMDNKLSIHFGEDKTKCILFTTKNKLKKWAICLLIMETSKLSNIQR